MKTLNFSKNSWHYWVAEFGCFDNSVTDNLCGYIWQVIQGLFFLTWLTFIVVFFAYCTLAEPVVYLYTVYQTGIWVKPDDFLQVGIGLWCGIILFTIFSAIAHTLSNYKEKRREARYNELYNGIPAPKDSFIVAVWRKFHDKTCAKIEFR